MAITAILLHNFYHKFEGAIKENEFIFHSESYQRFWSSIGHLDFSLFSDFFSFYGHYGVAVFFFISGYGLTQKYAGSDVNLSFFTFISKRIRKLWLLMFPVLFIMLIGVTVKAFYLRGLNGVFEHLGEVLIHHFYRITFIGNFIPGEALWLFGPWWFFSAILQIYVIYWLFLRKLTDNWKLCAIGILCISAQIGIYQLAGSEALEMTRYNFPAWLPIFILGMICARNSRLELSPVIVIVLLLVGLIADINVYVWLLCGAIAFFPYLVLGFAMRNFVKLKAFFIWVGTISAHLFVLNALVRMGVEVIFPTDKMWSSGVLCLVGLLFFAICLLIASFYKRFLDFVVKKGGI